MAILKDFIGKGSDRLSEEAIRSTNLGDLKGDVFQGEEGRLNLGPETPLEIDNLTSAIERFSAAYKTGVSTLKSSFLGADAAVASITGNKERMNESLRKAKEEQEAGAFYLLDSQPFEEFIEAPTFNGFIDSAIEATGQFAPTAITSIIAAMTGAGVGAGLSYLTGANRLFAAAGSTGLTTIPASIAGKNFLKAEVEDILKKKVTLNVLQKQGKKTAITMTPQEEKIINLLYPYLRGQLRNKYATRGAVAGAFAQEQPIGTGIAFQDYAEQDMTDPITAFRAQQQGALFGIIGVGSEALIYKAIVNNVKSKAAKKLINERAVVDAPQRNALDVVARGLGTGALTGVSEGVAEALQEELSVQQKFQIDKDYTRTQANLDRLQALYMGTIGGMGIGTATGTSTAVIGKMRELAEIGYEKKMFDLYQKAKGRELNPILETQNDLSAQFADLQDPNVNRDYVWVDAQNNKAFSGIANRIDKIPNLEKTMIPGVGTFFTLDGDLNTRFINTMSAGALNRQRLLNFLDIYGNKPPSQGTGQRVVVTVRDKNDSILQRYDVGAGQEEESAIKAAENYIGGPDGTNGRKIVVQTLENFNESRVDKFPDQQEAMEEDLNDFESLQQQMEYDPSQDEFQTFDTEQERLFAQGVTEPTVVKDANIRGEAIQQGSVENPFTKADGKPYASKNPKFQVKETGQFQDLYKKILELIPEELRESGFLRFARAGKINDSAAKKYIELAEQETLFSGQGYGFAEKGDGVVIYKYNLPGATMDGPIEKDMAARIVNNVKGNKTLSQKDRTSKDARSRKRYARFALRNNDTGEVTPVDINRFTNTGRNLANVFGQGTDGDFESAIGGFAFLFSSLNPETRGPGPLMDQRKELLPNYTLLYDGGNVLTEPENFVPVQDLSESEFQNLKIYNKEGRPLSMTQMSRALSQEVPSAGKRTRLTDRPGMEGLDYGNLSDVEMTEIEADLAVQELEEEIEALKARQAIDLEVRKEGLTEKEIADGFFNSFVKDSQGVVIRDKTGRPSAKKKIKPFQQPESMILEDGQEVIIKKTINLKQLEQNQKDQLLSKEKSLSFAQNRYSYAQKSLNDQLEVAREGRMAEDITDQYAYESFPLYNPKVNRPLNKNLKGIQKQLSTPKTKKQKPTPKQAKVEAQLEARLDELEDSGQLTSFDTQMINQLEQDLRAEIEAEIEAEQEPVQQELNLEPVQQEPVQQEIDFTPEVEATPKEEKVFYSSTIEQHLGLEFLNSMKKIAKDVLGLKRNLLVFSTDEEIFVEDPQLQARIDAALKMFNPENKYRGLNLRGKGNTDVLLIQTREGFNAEDQGARLFAIAHEIGHSFIYQELDRSLKVPRLRKALEKAFQKELQTNSTEQYQLPNGKGFQEWISDQVATFLVDETKKAKNQEESFYKSIATKIKAFFTKYSEVANRRFTMNPVFNDYIQEVMLSNRNNNFRYEQKASIEENVENLEKVLNKNAPKTLQRTVNKIIETGEIPSSKVDSATRTLRTIFQDKDGLLRSFGEPGKALAKLFKQRVGTREATGYLTKVFSLARAKMNEVQTILGVETASDMNQEVEKILQELEDPNNQQLSEKAQEIRNFLTKHYNDLNLGELGVGFLESYFPRLFLMEELLNDPGKREQLANLLVEYNDTLTISDARDAIVEMLKDPEEDANFSRDEEESFAVGMLAQRAELFRNIPTKDLREAGLLEDASYSLQRYIQNSVKRRGFADFGGSKAINEQLNKIKDPKERALAEDAVRAILGRVDPIQSNLFRGVNNVGLFFNVATLLPLSVFASFPDVAGPILRYRGFPPFLETMRTIMAAMSEEELAKFGKDIGATGINAMNEQYVGAGELQYTSKGTKQATNKFFRFIQLEQFTNFTRRFAAGMARIFLIDNANKAIAGDEVAQRYLAELDVTAEEILAWGDGDITAPGNQRVRVALARFVDEAIVRPNAAERPLWASDPRFALVWQLKSFFYSYGKNIVMGTGREMQSRMEEAGIKGAAVPLFMAAVTLLPLTMLGLDMRERFKIGLAWALPGVSPQDKNYRRSLDMDMGEYSIEILDRSGLLGPYTMALPLFIDEKRYGDPLWVGPLGPTIGTGYDLISGDIKARNLIPFYSAL